MSAVADHGLMDGDTIGKQHAPGLEVALPGDSLHEKFVNFVRALSESTETRWEVWMEHSYARVRRSGSAGGAAARSLLVRRALPCPDCHADEDVAVDVLTVSEPVESPLSPEPQPQYERALSEEDMLSPEGSETEDWEEKLDSLAPSPAHRRLAANVVELIRSLRVARLAGAPRSARAHAARLRSELAPLWNYPGPLQQRPAAWMHAVLSAYLPRPYLHVYNDMLSELCRCVPRLVERLLAGQVPPAPGEREAGGPRLVPAADRPLLVWLPSGREKRDALWERSLAHVVPTHRITAPQVSECSPDAWCSAVASAARTALTAASHLPHSGLVLGGWGAGAALALHLAATWDAAAGDTPRALVLLAPPLLTAEGARDAVDDPMLDLKMPMLFVVGQNAMQCTVDVAEEVRAALSTWSRLVVVGAADDALRLSQHKLRSERVTQAMVHAALAEEVRGFVSRALREEAEECDEGEEADGDPEPSEPPEPLEDEPEPVAPRRRTHTPTVHTPTTSTHHKRPRYGVELVSTSPTPASAPTVAPAPVSAAASAPTPTPALAQTPAPASPVSPAAPSAGKGRGLALLRVSSAPLDPNTTLTGRTTTDWEEMLQNDYQQKTEARRNIRITETIVTRGTVLNGNGTKGYSVVSRGTGSVPLCLPPPRRAAPQAALAPADIMQLPIVFADDDADIEEEPAPPPAASAPNSTITISPKMGSAVVTRRESTPLKYTKVILAKRPTVPTSVTAGAPRPIIVKGGMKILPKGLVIKRTSVGALRRQDRSPSDKSV